MAKDMSNVVKDITLLGNKSYLPQTFTLKELISQDSPYIEPGLYKEGIQPDEITFKLAIEVNDLVYINPNAGAYWMLMQIAVWDNNNTPITTFNLEKHNAYLNNDLTGNKPSCRFLRDGSNNRYEILGSGWHNNYNVNNFKPGGSFGPPMSVGSVYPYCGDWFVNKDTTTPKEVIIQTDNPNIKALSFTTTIPTAWSTTMTGPATLKVNNNVIFEHQTAANLIANERLTAANNVKYSSRYIAVKQDDGNIKIFKTWILDKNYNNVIEYNIYLVGRVMREMKQVTLQELIDNEVTDGTYDDLKDTALHLHLQAEQRWVTVNTGEVLFSGGIIWNESSDVLTPFKSVAYKANTQSGHNEIIETGTDSNKLTFYAITDKLPQSATTKFGATFGKNIFTSTAAGVPTWSIFKTSGVGNSVNIELYFVNNIKAIALDTSSIYDLKFNNTTANRDKMRHIGFFKSITHDVVLHDVNSKVEWMEKYSKTVNNKIYAARCIFTKTEAFIVYMNVTDSKVAIISNNLYLFHALTNEMLDYTIDEVIQLFKNNKIAYGNYLYSIIPVITYKLKLTKTFENTNNSMGINKLVLLEKLDKTNTITDLTFLSNNIVYKDNKLYKITSNPTLDKNTDYTTLITKNKGLIIDNTYPIEFSLQTDNPNAKLIEIIPWYAPKTTDTETNIDIQNFVGKLEINDKLIYDYADVATYEQFEFKTVDNKLYGSCYLYDIETLDLKKCWVLIKDGIPTGTYLYYTNDKMGPVDIDGIFENPNSDGSIDEELKTVPCKAFRITLLNGATGGYGGANYRVYPIINGKIYKGAYYSSNTTASSGTQVITIMDSNIDVTDIDNKIQFATDCDTKAVFTSPIVAYNSSISTPSLSGNMIRMNATFTGKYSNGAYYQPAYMLGQTANSNSTYFLGSTNTASRVVTFKITDISHDLGDVNIEGLIIMPWRNASTSGRYCLNQRYELLDEDNNVINSLDTSVTEYKAWCLTAIQNETAIELI